jgi:hypothetical protein
VKSELIHSPLFTCKVNSGDEEMQQKKDEGEEEEQWRRQGCFEKFLQWFRCHLARDKKREQRGTRMKN